MLNIILLDSAIELIPKEIINHPAVIKNARKRGKKPAETLLDISLHYSAMKNLPFWEKRGRPDIVHIAMIVLLSEKEMISNFFIHTFDSKIIKVDPSMRPPKNYNRFVPLMEQLLKYGQVPLNSEKPLMKILNATLGDIVKGYEPILLSEEGRRINPKNLCGENYLLGIGGFQRGDFSEEVKKVFKDKVYSISDKRLETHQVICRILTSCINDIT